MVTMGAETAEEMGMKGKWVYTTQCHSWTPFLQYSEKRNLREELYRKYFIRSQQRKRQQRGIKEYYSVKS